MAFIARGESGLATNSHFQLWLATHTHLACQPATHACPQTVPCPHPSLQMKCTGIPELQSVEDIEYLRNVFVLDKTAEEAEEVFREKIGECLRLAWTVQINFWVHTAVTGSRT